MAISYSGTPYFSTALLTTATVTNTGVAGGTYSSTVGLSINPETGVVDLISSTVGTYTVTYTALGLSTVTTTIEVNHSFSDINDLYAQTLLLDKPYVDECIAEIKAEMFTKITNAEDPWFDYDSEPIIGVLEPIQQYRVKDQVVLQLRDMGIRVKLPPNYVSSIIYPSIPVETSYMLTISWFLRDAREYMKQYV